MRVRIGDIEYSAEAQPIMLILTDKDKENITNMLPECSKYCAYPANTDLDEIIEFMDSVPSRAQAEEKSGDERGSGE